MILLKFFSKISSCKKILWCIVGRQISPFPVISRHMIISRNILSLSGNDGLLYSLEVIWTLEGIFIIYKQRGTLNINDRHLLNIRFLLHSSKSPVFEWILLLWRVIVSPLNLLISLSATTLIFQFAWTFFLCVPFHPPPDISF